MIRTCAVAAAALLVSSTANAIIVAGPGETLKWDDLDQFIKLSVSQVEFDRVEHEMRVYSAKFVLPPGIGLTDVRKSSVFNITGSAMETDVDIHRDGNQYWVELIIDATSKIGSCPGGGGDIKTCLWFQVGDPKTFEVSGGLGEPPPPPPPPPPPTEVAEPMSLGLIGAGLAGLLWRRRKS